MLFATLLLLAAPAQLADAPLAAQREYAAGARDFAEKRYFEALEHFRAADRLRPSANLAYDIARCDEQLGDLLSARRAYLEVLRRAPGAPDRDEVDAAIASIDARLTLGDVTSAPGSGGRQAAGPSGPSGEPRAPGAAPPGETPGRSHLLAWSLLGAGAAALIGGGVLNLLAAQQVGSPDALAEPPAVVSAQNPRAQGLFTAAIVCYAAGAALGVGGLLDYWLSR